jgi:hypothetical protein
MPERDKAVLKVIELMLGDHPTDPIIGRPYAVKKSDWEGLQAMVDEAFVAVVEHIDWGRVLMTAQARHEALMDADKHPDPPEEGSLKDVYERAGVCPECIVSALLHESTMGSLYSAWVQDPDPERAPEWRTEWLEEAGGKFALFQRMLPMILENLHTGEESS